MPQPLRSRPWSWKQSCKSVRRTCKLFSELFNPLALFYSIDCYASPLSIAHCIKLSKNSRIADSILRVVIHEPLLTKDIMKLTEYARERATSMRKNWEHQLSSTDLTNEERAICIDALRVKTAPSKSQLDEEFLKYRDQHSIQRYLLESGSWARELKTALLSFSRLRTFIITDVPWTKDYSTYNGFNDRDPAVASKQFPGVILRDSNCSEELSSKATRDFLTQVFNMMFSQGQLEEVGFPDATGLPLNFTIPQTTLEILQVTGGFCSLRRLLLSVSPRFSSEESFPDSSNSILSFLNNTPYLEELEIKTENEIWNYFEGTPSIKQLGAVTLPRLKHFAVEKLALCGDSFFAFLLRHESLTRLNLKQVAMCEGSGWRKTFTAIRSLPVLELYDFTALVASTEDSDLICYFDPKCTRKRHIERDTKLFIDKVTDWTAELSEVWRD